MQGGGSSFLSLLGWVYGRCLGNSNKGDERPRSQTERVVTDRGMDVGSPSSALRQRWRCTTNLSKGWSGDEYSVYTLIGRLL